jgi:hypothetical protein
MKIYVITFNLTAVLQRLVQFRLNEFNHEYPDIFVEAADPDEACYLAYCKFSETLLKQKPSDKIALFIKDIENDIRIIKVVCKDEKKL